jgi:hypothetical protein
MNSFDNRTKLVISALLGVVFVCIMLARSSFFDPEGAGIMLVTNEHEPSDAGPPDAFEYPYPNHSDAELEAMSREDPVARNELLRRRMAACARVHCCCDDDADGGVEMHLLRVEYH